MGRIPSQLGLNCSCSNSVPGHLHRYRGIILLRTTNTRASRSGPWLPMDSVSYEHAHSTLPYVHACQLALTVPNLQPLYPTLLILLVARHKTPLTETLTSIDVDVDFAAPTSPRSASSTVEEVELRTAPDSVGKFGDERYDLYAGSTVTSPRARSPSVRLEPNRRV